MEQDLLQDSFFSQVTAAPPDPIFGIQSIYKSDTRDDKVNLTVGYLSSEDGAQPIVLNAVKDAASEIYETESTKNYLPISGDSSYVESVKRFIFGDLAPETMIGFGTAGGTAAISLVAELVFAHVTKNVCLSSPTWPNHIQIFERVGFNVEKYPYEIDGKVNFDAIFDHLTIQPKNTLVLFQPMSHNPTGCDLTMDEWKILSNLCKEKRLLPMFDSAYQGLGVGIREDVEPICQFISDGHEVIVTHSFSKSMGLYGERVGAAFIAATENSPIKNIQDQLKVITRTQYSNPPRHGEILAHLILSNPERRNLWEKELEQMRVRVDLHRQKLAEGFEKISGNDCTHIKNGHGFFCNLGLSKESVIKLREEFGLYIGGTSRVNIAALTSQNFDSVMKKLQGVV